MHDSRRTRLTLGVLLVAALALITFDSWDGTAGPVGGLRGVGGTIFGSAESLAGSIARPVAGFFTNAASAFTKSFLADSVIARLAVSRLSYPI